MSIKREVIMHTTYTCDACSKDYKDKTNAWAKLKLVCEDKKIKTMDICNECCYKIHQASGLNLLP